MNARSLTDRMIDEKIREQRDRLRGAIEEVQAILQEWDEDATTSEEAIQKIRDVLDYLPRYVA